MATLNISVHEFPARRLKALKVAPTKTVSELRAMLPEDVRGRHILVDGGSFIPGIIHEDPVNEYYRGMPGDIYRIEDAGKVRYRRVVRGELLRKEVKRTDVIPQVVGLTYIRAVQTVMQMCQDRKMSGAMPDWTPDDIVRLLETDELLLRDMKDRNGRQVCIFFMGPEESLDSKTIDHYVGRGLKYLSESSPAISRMQGDTVFNLNEPRSHQQYAPHGELLIIYNSPDYKMPPARLKFSSNFLQFMSVQQLQHNITRHQDQPIFTLLEKSDSKEILDVYMLNGQLLEDGKPLSEYNLTPAEPGMPVQLIII